RQAAFHRFFDDHFLWRPHFLDVLLAVWRAHLHSANHHRRSLDGFSRAIAVAINGTRPRRHNILRGRDDSAWSHGEWPWLHLRVGTINRSGRWRVRRRFLKRQRSGRNSGPAGCFELSVTAQNGLELV